MLVPRQADGSLIDLGSMMLKLMDGHLGRTCTHLFLAGEEGELGKGGVAGSKEGEEDGGLGAGIRGRLVLATPLLPPATLRDVRRPTEADVNEHHARYIAALTELYDRHKATYYGEAAAANMSLEIW